MARLLGRLQRKKPPGAVERATSVLENVRTRFGKATSAKSEGGAYGKAAGLGIGALAILVIISLSVWLLRKRAGEETTPDTPEAEEE